MFSSLLSASTHLSPMCQLSNRAALDFPVIRDMLYNRDHSNLGEQKARHSTSSSLMEKNPVTDMVLKMKPLIYPHLLNLLGHTEKDGKCWVPMMPCAANSNACTISPSDGGEDEYNFCMGHYAHSCEQMPDTEG